MEILLFGNGGHAKVLKDLAILNKYTNCFFFNNEKEYSEFFHTAKPIIIAIGSNNIRKKVAQFIKHSFATLIHPTAVIANDVVIGEGTVVLANAVIQAGAIIGNHCIINANVVIDHDVIVNDFCSIYPGAYIGSGVTLSESVNIEPLQIVERNSII